MIKSSEKFFLLIQICLLVIFVTLLDHIDYLDVKMLYMINLYFAHNFLCILLYVFNQSISQYALILNTKIIHLQLF